MRARSFRRLTPAGKLERCLLVALALEWRCCVPFLNSLCEPGLFELVREPFKLDRRRRLRVVPGFGRSPDRDGDVRGECERKVVLEPLSHAPIEEEDAAAAVDRRLRQRVRAPEGAARQPFVEVDRQSLNPVAEQNGRNRMASFVNGEGEPIRVDRLNCAGDRRGRGTQLRPSTDCRET